VDSGSGVVLGPDGAISALRGTWGGGSTPANTGTRDSARSRGPAAHNRAQCSSLYSAYGMGGLSEGRGRCVPKPEAIQFFYLALKRTA
jgi:hypothetical protein